LSFSASTALPHVLEKKLAVVLFGSPGSGKGTQSKFLVTRFGIPQISTGDMLRDHIRNGDEIGRSIEATMRAGSLVPDELVNELVEKRLKQADAAHGFILDGYPRTSAQGVVLLDLLERNAAEPVVIHLIVDYNVIIARIAARRQCPKCGTLYNLLSRKPRVPGICDLDGETLIIREDDREEVIRERLDAYDRETRPLIEFFRKMARRFYEVNASEVTPQSLSDEISDLLLAAASGDVPGSRELEPAHQEGFTS
jgi:adenylate kinase